MKFISFDNVIFVRIVKSLAALCICYIIYKIVALLLIKFFNKAILRDKENKRQKTIYNLLLNILKYVFMILTLIWVLQINGVNVSAMLAGIGIVGVVIGLAIQDALKDIIRGATLLTDNYFKVGDIIKIGDNTGEVLYMGLKSTRIKDIYTQNIVSIANRNIEKVEILSSMLYINVPMPYETTLKDAEKAMKDLEKEVNKLENIKSATYSNVAKIGESSIEYRLNCEVNNKFLLPTTREVNKCIIEVLAKNNISIPYNQLDIHNKK